MTSNTGEAAAAGALAEYLSLVVKRKKEARAEELKADAKNLGTKLTMTRARHARLVAKKPPLAADDAEEVEYLVAVMKNLEDAVRLKTDRLSILTKEELPNVVAAIALHSARAAALASRGGASKEPSTPSASAYKTYDAVPKGKALHVSAMIFDAVEDLRLSTRPASGNVQMLLPDGGYAAFPLEMGERATAKFAFDPAYVWPDGKLRFKFAFGGGVDWAPRDEAVNAFLVHNNGRPGTTLQTSRARQGALDGWCCVATLK